MRAEVTVIGLPLPSALKVDTKRLPGRRELVCEKYRDVTIQRHDGNENVKNNNSFSRQNNNFARAAHFFVHFFADFARLKVMLDGTIRNDDF